VLSTAKLGVHSYLRKQPKYFRIPQPTFWLTYLLRSRGKERKLLTFLINYLKETDDELRSQSIQFLSVYLQEINGPADKKLAIRELEKVYAELQKYVHSSWCKPEEQRIIVYILSQAIRFDKPELNRSIDIESLVMAGFDLL
jgi:hypothetical protein